MKLWTSYLKRNIMWIAALALILVSQCLILYLVNVPLQDMLYGLLVELFLILFILLVDLLWYRRRVLQLREQNQQAISDNLELPESRDAIEEEYQDLVENINIERQIYESRESRERQEMREYYEMWVHQIKTPIAGLNLLIQMQKNREEPMTSAQYGELEEELFRIEQYTNMALQYQRLTADSNDFLLEGCNLDSIVREVIRKYAKLMIRKKLGLNYEGTDAKILSDEKWLSFVVEQVLSNAIKYTREGGIVVDVVEETNWLYLRISDSGIGIGQEDLPRVFEKGYTGYNGHSDKRSTGIGLYLCKQVLNKLGHTMRIESRVGQGTTVWIGISRKKGCGYE